MLKEIVAENGFENILVEEMFADLCISALFRHIFHICVKDKFVKITKIFSTQKCSVIEYLTVMYLYGHICLFVYLVVFIITT